MNLDRRAAWEQLNAEVFACTRCPRLVEWREKVAREKRRAFQGCSYWGKPVPGFGDLDPRLLVIGLAPAAHGANRTGRMFTGDSSGDTLLGAFHRAGLANQPTSVRQGDGLELHDSYMTAVARCAPPGNRPTPQEQANCRPYLAQELTLFPLVRVVLTLGRVAFEGYLHLLREQGVAAPRLSPRHGDTYVLGPALPTLVFSYHPSRQNTQTGRLTMGMLDQVFMQVREMMG